MKFSLLLRIIGIYRPKASSKNGLKSGTALWKMHLVGRKISKAYTATWFTLDIMASHHLSLIGAAHHTSRHILPLGMYCSVTKTCRFMFIWSRELDLKLAVM